MTADVPGPSEGETDRSSGPYTFEFEDGSVRAWHLTAEGVEPELVDDYEPALFVAGPEDALATLTTRLTSDPKVVEVGISRRYTTLRDTKSEPDRLLRVALERVGELRTLAHEIRSHHERETLACSPGTLRLFDVDLAPGFRYCLDRRIDPTPTRELRTLGLDLDERALADGDVSRLRIDGDRVDGTPAAVCASLSRRLDRVDPDVLVVSHGDLVPLLFEKAADAGCEEFRLGRLPGWTQLAGESTYASYGQVGYSPARYRVPGRAIVDRSNSFLWNQSGLGGILYMVRRSGRPLQEAAWGSIGTILTSRQIRLVRERRDVLAPWNKWEPERFSDVRTLHAADRGGFTFAPEAGFHETVHEIDFASLYPRIICTHNVSPETVDCACCGPDGDGTPRERVPELDYRICAHDGFLPAVLEPLLEDRAAIKRRLAEEPPVDEAAQLRAASGAIKWVLVSCFGYQGYRNAKFGRIECHESINAYAREILLETKARLEAGGWRIVHGIVDSLWVTPATDTPEPLEDVIADVSADVEIALEHDGTFEWVCFVPLRESVRRRAGTDETGRGGPSEPGSAAALAGALTRYFGKREDGSYKVRGIELRQRSTPSFVADCQREAIETLDAERDPVAVCDRLARRLGELRSGAVDPADLVVTKRVSKPLADYRQETHPVGALRRYEACGMTRRPGQSVRYVVVDDGARRARDRVRLDVELDERESGTAIGYDVDYYARLLVRATESVVSPLGWDRTRIRRAISGTRTLSLSAFFE